MAKADPNPICFAPFHPDDVEGYDFDRNDKGLVLAVVHCGMSAKLLGENGAVTNKDIEVEVSMCRWHHDTCFGPVGGSV